MSESRDAQRRQTIFARRAKALLSSGGGSEFETLSFLQVRFGDELFGLRVEQVKETVQLDPEQLTSLPWADPSIVGMANIRGQITGVIDPSGALKMPKPVIVDKVALVVLKLPNERAAIQVDEVYGIQTVPRSEVLAAQGDFLEGVTRNNVQLLNIFKLVEEKGLL